MTARVLFYTPVFEKIQRGYRSALAITNHLLSWLGAKNLYRLLSSFRTELVQEHTCDAILQNIHKHSCPWAGGMAQQVKGLYASLLYVAGELLS